MSKVTMIGCDLHDRNMLLKIAVGRSKPRELEFLNDCKGRCKMITALKKTAREEGDGRIVFVYEASGLGHGLSDQLDEAGIECHVLSPNQLPKTPKSAKLKTDAKDAMMLLEQVRGFVLAGNSMPVVWTPPKQLRADRELVRARVDSGDEITRVKLKLKSFMKVNQLSMDCPTSKLWTKAHIHQIRKELLKTLDFSLATKLDLLMKRLEYYHQEQLELDRALKTLSRTDRYKAACGELRKLPGVGLLVAMTFLTEMGDLNRFHNRREVAAYLGLCPASYESGNTDDRKGRITRQGPARLRKVLCQAAWVSVQRCEIAGATYHRIRQGQQKRTKKALVALMRKLAIKMWHQGMSMGVSPELEGRGGPHTLLDYGATSA
jgi:transposase